MQMRRLGTTCALASLLSAASSGGWAAAPGGGPLRIVPPRASVEPGGVVQLRDVPPAPIGREPLPPNFRRIWLASGPGSIDHDTGRYLAPYVVPAEGGQARIVLYRGLKPDVDSAEAFIDLRPGSVPGADGCLGPGQTWGASGRGPDYVYMEELPEPITRVTPEYPTRVAARHLSGHLVVNVLLCRTGHVLDATATWPVGATPIPELEALAVDAARQWVFKPGLVGGQPVATTVAIPFTFPPR